MHRSVPCFDRSPSFHQPLSEARRHSARGLLKSREKRSVTQRNLSLSKAGSAFAFPPRPCSAAVPRTPTAGGALRAPSGPPGTATPRRARRCAAEPCSELPRRQLRGPEGVPGQLPGRASRPYLLRSPPAAPPLRLTGNRVRRRRQRGPGRGGRDGR